jgi:hypothetical protein
MRVSCLFSATSAISGFTTIEPPFQVALNKSELGKLKDPEAPDDKLWRATGGTLRFAAHTLFAT